MVLEIALGIIIAVIVLGILCGVLDALPDGFWEWFWIVAIGVAVYLFCPMCLLIVLGFYAGYLVYVYLTRKKKKK